ncbi:MAG: nickel pincer cofactor biosynthesis protein LarC [Nitrososphaerales archaeon]|nr:nickel pincer cofactor biosynthesis protein LarC [Nitrososphaerales archaeon]
MVLERMMVIDCQTAGVSGDMVLGALIDLGVDAFKFKEAMSMAGDCLKGVKSLDIEIKDVKRRGFRAKRVEVRAHEDFERREGVEMKEAIKRCLDNLGLRANARTFSLSAMDTLLDAEARVHGESINEVHLHELGSVDTLVDIVGTAFCLENLGLFKNTRIYSTPVAIGGGSFRTLEGILSSPSPAVVEIFRSKMFAMMGGPIDAELCTPTGASILVSMAEPIVHYPLFRPSVTGYGAGSRDFDEFPNLLRLTLGDAMQEFLFDEVSVIETNLDDVSGEVIGYAMDRLMKEGARSVSVIPIYTKRNRPGQMVQIIADHDQVEQLSRVLMEETGTLGVRVTPCKRRILVREFFDVKIELNGIERSIRIKAARDGKGNIIRMKPEYEDARKIAEELGLPLRVILSLAEEKARSTLLKGTKG